MDIRDQRGFSLVEIIISVLLMSVVLGLSVPSYRNYTLKTERTDASNALLQLTVAQERYYLTHGTYADNNRLQQATPDGLGFSDGLSSQGYYDLSIEPHTEGLTVGYIATATVNTENRQRDDIECLSLSTDQDGRRSANGDYNNAVVMHCWQ